MTNEDMTHEEKANTDKLKFYYEEKVAVHLILKRKTPNNKNIFYNGFITGNPSERLWIIKDRIDGEIKLSISEIEPWGIKDFKGELR